jgi:hypothetical protein
MTSEKRKRLLMHPDWLWHQAVADLKAGKFDNPVQEIVNGVSRSTRVYVNAFYCTNFGDDDFDPYETDDTWDQVEFIAKTDGIAADKSASRTPTGLLTAASRATSLTELGNALDPVRDHEWVWINLWIGHDFTLDPERRKHSSWTATELYNNLLKPLRPWFA